MAFDIKFVGDAFEDDGMRRQQVSLMIGAFEESMDADMTHWTFGDYQDQWANELRKVIGESARGALITSLPDPNLAFRVSTWPMWREGDEIFFQSRLVGMLEPDSLFHIDCLADYVCERKSINEDGILISQWSIPVRDVIAFLDCVK